MNWFRLIGMAVIPAATGLLMPTAALAQRIPVYLSNTTPDPVGSRLAYAIRENLRRSAGLDVVDLEQDGRMALRLVTLDPDRARGSGGNQTVYSVVITAQTLHEIPVTMYMNNIVGTCGSQRIQDCAEALVADVDNQAGLIRTVLRNIKR